LNPTSAWSPAVVLADNRIKREQIGSTVVVEKLNKRGIMQGLKNPVVIAIAFTFLLNNISVQGESTARAQSVQCSAPCEFGEGQN
jgi:hypothetical protein